MKKDTRIYRYCWNCHYEDYMSSKAKVCPLCKGESLRPVGWQTDKKYLKTVMKMSDEEIRRFLNK